MSDDLRASCLACRSARDHERHARELTAAFRDLVRMAAGVAKGASDDDIIKAVAEGRRAKGTK